MKEYKHVFFDLDHTLWDADRASEQTLFELYELFALDTIGGFSKEELVKEYCVVNYELWSLLDQGKLSKEGVRKNRFPLVFERLGVKINPSKAEELSVEYLQRCPRQPFLVKHARGLLDALSDSGRHELHIITNGFLDSQKIKMKASGLNAYFKNMTTSECTGYMKPHPRIFEYAFGLAGADAKNSIMIGDSIDSDIKGALGVGMDAAFFKQREVDMSCRPTYQVDSLSALHEILGLS